MLTTTDVFDGLAANALQSANPGAPAILSGAKMVLYTGALQITKKLTPADLTPPAFAGYAPVVLQWNAGVRDASGIIGMISQLATFQPTDATAPAIITGYGITNSQGDALLAVEQLPNAVPMVDNSSFLGVVSQISLGRPPSGQCTVVV